MAPRILLTSTAWWPIPSRLAISLRRAGFKVYAICPVKGHPLRKTGGIDQIFPYSPVRPVKALRAAVAVAEPDLIVPCDDWATGHLHQLYAACTGDVSGDAGVRALLERSLGPAESFAIVASRYQLLTAAKQAGVRVPYTQLIESVGDIRTFAHVFPAVLKLNGSWGGLGISMVESEAKAVGEFLRMTAPISALRVLKRLIVNRDPFWISAWWNAGTRTAVLQELVPGRPANCSVLAWKGRVLACIAVQVLRAESVTGPATIVQIIENAEMRNAAETIAGRLQLSGFFGLDFMLDDRSGAAYLIEMNPRCTQPAHLPLGNGRDLTASLYGAISGTPAESAVATRKDIISYFPQAWRWDRESIEFEISYQDIPGGEESLIRELLKIPWPDRSLLAQVSDRLRNMHYEKRKAAVVGFTPRKVYEISSPVQH